MKLLEHVLNPNTHQHKNHYQKSEHNWKINMSNMKRGGPICNNNLFIILLGDPNSWNITPFFFFYGYVIKIY